MTLSIIMDATGRVPQSPDDINTALIALATGMSPGLTANLPASLVEDLSSTATAALLVADSAVTELINSISPLGANLFLLKQLGQLYLGAQNGAQGAATNNSVNVVFSGPPGFPIPVGFTVSDGSYQYVIRDGGIIGQGGTSSPLFCLAVLSGSWVISQNTVNQLVTSVPKNIGVTVTNPLAGTEGLDAETEEAYRARVLEAGLAKATGMATYLKTLLVKVSGVQPRLVSVRQITGGGWEVLCGGGDPYEVAYAVFSALFDVSTLKGSVLNVTGITQANPGVVTTDLTHGFANGQVINIAGVSGMTQVDNTPLTVSVISPHSFSIGDTSSYSAYVSGGVVTPNLRNQTVTINDYPDRYLIPLVTPLQQIVTLAVTWNTSATNFISTVAVAQLAIAPIVSYINNIPAGAPINLLQIQSVFKDAVKSTVPPDLLTRLVISVSVDGLGAVPDEGTEIIPGDPESYFFTNTSGTGISINKG